MDKLAANITQAGTFLFRSPADSEKITQRHINRNMVAWIFDPRDAYEYVTLLQVDRFTLTRNNSQCCYATLDEPLEEITKEEAEKLYGLLKQHTQQKQAKQYQKK